MGSSSPEVLCPARLITTFRVGLANLLVRVCYRCYWPGLMFESSDNMRVYCISIDLQSKSSQRIISPEKQRTVGLAAWRLQSARLCNIINKDLNFTQIWVKLLIILLNNPLRNLSDYWDLENKTFWKVFQKLEFLCSKAPFFAFTKIPESPTWYYLRFSRAPREGPKSWDPSKRSQSVNLFLVF